MDKLFPLSRTIQQPDWFSITIWFSFLGLIYRSCLVSEFQSIKNWLTNVSLLFKCKSD